MDQVKTNEEIRNKQDQKVNLPHKNSKLFLLKSSSILVIIKVMKMILITIALGIMIMIIV